MEKELISGSGEKVPVIGVGVIILLVICAVCMIMGIDLINIAQTPITVDKGSFMGMSMGNYVTKHPKADELIFFGVGCILVSLAMLIYFIVASVVMKKTHISVYEDGVSGVSTDVKSGLTMNHFKFTYDQITSVDLSKNYNIVIHASGAKYRCYLTNGMEIQDAIFKQKKSNSK